MTDTNLGSSERSTRQSVASELDVDNKIELNNASGLSKEGDEPEDSDSDLGMVIIESEGHTYTILYDDDSVRSFKDENGHDVPEGTKIPVDIGFKITFER